MPEKYLLRALRPFCVLLLLPTPLGTTNTWYRSKIFLGNGKYGGSPHSLDLCNYRAAVFDAPDVHNPRLINVHIQSPYLLWK
mmetsp:Transcript_21762/g.39129  ORF Transcript_21762/g.39129 Transcript_21762/m.39129 type:complete len:82 (-) Transcript_21762:570-815(-)